LAAAVQSMEGEIVADSTATRGSTSQQTTSHEYAARLPAQLQLRQLLVPGQRVHCVTPSPPKLMLIMHLHVRFVMEIYTIGEYN